MGSATVIGGVIGGVCGFAFGPWGACAGAAAGALIGRWTEQNAAQKQEESAQQQAAAAAAAQAAEGAAAERRAQDLVVMAVNRLATAFGVATPAVIFTEDIRVNALSDGTNIKVRPSWLRGMMGDQCAVADRACNEGIAYAVLAHEMGHHIEGHAWIPKSIMHSHDKELVADFYMGRALALFGHPDSMIEMAMAKLPPNDTLTHPAREKRLAAAAAGHAYQIRYDLITRLVAELAKLADVVPDVTASALLADQVVGEFDPVEVQKALSEVERVLVRAETPSSAAVATFRAGSAPTTRARELLGAIRRQTRGKA